jgi:hypothetical protein
MTKTCTQLIEIHNKSNRLNLVYTFKMFKLCLNQRKKHLQLFIVSAFEAANRIFRCRDSGI